MYSTIYQWAVIGAGPAGIAAIGKLLDNGVSAKDILWLDPQFKVGDLGLHWQNVSSNTTVQRFIDFLNDADSFGFQKAVNDFRLTSLPPDDTCTLSEIVAPLQWISGELRQRVDSAMTTIHSLTLNERTWTLDSDSKTYKAKNIILATGAVPSSLNYPGVDALPFEIAIDKEQLSGYVNQNHSYAVFGSSHSAIMILRYLVDLGVKKIINFYRSPCRYAIEMGGWILFDNTGLKGQTAAWARENIDGSLPANLVRHKANENNIAQYLPLCDKVIYAVGFERRNSIVIEGYEEAEYNPHTGIIAPGLFGFGIAYPELKPDPLGSVESQVGLWKFMVYLNKIMPTWFKYPA